jgi:hypothetical protein
MSASPQSADREFAVLRGPQAPSRGTAPCSPLGCGARVFGFDTGFTIAGAIAASVLGWSQAPPLLPSLLAGIWVGAWLGARSAALQSARWRASAVAWEAALELALVALVLGGLAAADPAQLEGMLEALGTPLALLEMAAAVPLSYAALLLGEQLGLRRAVARAAAGLRV